MSEDRQRRRLEQELKAVEKQYELWNEKLIRLSEARAIENDVATVFKQDKQIKEAKVEINRLILKLELLEEQLAPNPLHSMTPNSSNFDDIIKRILNGTQTEGDLKALGYLLESGNRETISQLGKYNVNIGDAKDIHIGDRIYNQWDENAIKDLIIKVIEDNRYTNQNPPTLNQQRVQFRENHEALDSNLTKLEQHKTNLSQWLDNIIDSTWQIVDPELLVSFKIQNNQRIARVKKINLGDRHIIYLLVSVLYATSDERSIVLHIYPTKDKIYLPLGFKFNILDSSGQFIQQATATHQDKWMKQEIRAKTGEEFSINLKLNNYNTFDRFII